MNRRLAHLLLLALGIAPIAIYSAQQPPAGPTAEQVFKNVKSFKGVPANDLIPAMEFMSASLGYQCTDCHDAKDYSAETRTKETARNMIAMQRDINSKYFNNRLEITCMSCHNGKEHPASTPIPQGINLRHERIETTVKPEELFAKHVASVGKVPVSLVRVGVLTAPNDATHKPETTPLEFAQTDTGKFRLVSGGRKVIFDGKQITYGGQPMADEPAAIFGRIGRAWRGDQAFAGLERTTISGKDMVGKARVMVVRGTRPATTSTEELFFDTKSNLLVRMVNIKRSTLGAVVTGYDYSNYKSVNGTKVPMKVVITFAGGETWTMEFKSAKVEATVDETAFGVGNGTH